MTCGCAHRCVVCEVDGRPMDPVLLADRQAAEAESRATVERLLSGLPAYVPGPTTVPAPPERVTARQRGRARREAISAAIGAQTAGIGLPDVPSTGWSDRRSTGGERRGRGVVHGRRKHHGDRVMDGTR